MSPDSNDLRDHAWRFLRTSPQHAALLLDSGGTIVWANATAGDIFGADGLEGHHVSVCFLEEDVAHGVPSFETGVAEATGAMDDDRWMRRADGSRFWAEGATVALRSDDDDTLLGFVKILRNRTTQKMATETLRNEVTNRAEHAEECETAMVTLAHELRNPLATMMACADLLDRLPANDARVEATHGMLRRSLGFAARLVDDLVDTTRASTGRLDLQTELLSVDELLRSAIATAQSRADMAARVDLLLPQAELRVEADPLRMHQVFVNLVGNAIRYTPSGRRIWVTAVQQGKSVQVKVQDEGIGIAPDVLEHIFDMFSQGRDTAMRGGLGIGLSLVKQIVELHGGSVQAQSDGPDKGSVFLASIPLRQHADEAPVGDG
jgi:two-component system CheB/CheR fusion protein